MEIVGNSCAADLQSWCDRKWPKQRALPCWAKLSWFPSSAVGTAPYCCLHTDTRQPAPLWASGRQCRSKGRQASTMHQQQPFSFGTPLSALQLITLKRKKVAAVWNARVRLKVLLRTTCGGGFSLELVHNVAIPHSIHILKRCLQTTETVGFAVLNSGSYRGSGSGLLVWQDALNGIQTLTRAITSRHNFSREYYITWGSRDSSHIPPQANSPPPEWSLRSCVDCCRSLAPQ